MRTLDRGRQLMAMLLVHLERTTAVYRSLMVLWSPSSSWSLSSLLSEVSNPRRAEKPDFLMID